MWNGLSLLGVGLLIDQAYFHPAPFSLTPPQPKPTCSCSPSASQIFLSSLHSSCHGTVRTICCSAENLIMWESLLSWHVPPLPWGLQALVQHQPSGKGEIAIWAPSLKRSKLGKKCCFNQALTWVWSGGMIGLWAASLALLLAAMKSKSQLLGALVSPA